MSSQPRRRLLRAPGPALLRQVYQDYPQVTCVYLLFDHLPRLYVSFLLLGLPPAAVWVGGTAMNESHHSHRALSLWWVLFGEHAARRLPKRYLFPRLVLCSTHICIMCALAISLHSQIPLFALCNLGRAKI
jgi:hypothetical protein